MVRKHNRFTTNKLTRVEGLCSKSSQRLCLQSWFVAFGLVHTTHLPQFSVIVQPEQVPHRFLLVLFTPAFTGDDGKAGEGGGVCVTAPLRNGNGDLGDEI